MEILIECGPLFIVADWTTQKLLISNSKSFGQIPYHFHHALYKF